MLTRWCTTSHYDVIVFAQAYDHNKLHALRWMQGIYGDAVSNSYVAGTAIHWYDYLSGKIPGGNGGGGLAFDNLEAIHNLEPNKFIINTEACTLYVLEGHISGNESESVHAACVLPCILTMLTSTQ